jgi:energy-coupling factor transport system permease protein
MGWKLRDVILLVILSIVCGGIYRIWDVVTPFINITWVPGQGILNGIWWLAAILVPYIVRKPGAALLAEIISAMVELTLGSNWGMGGVLSGVLQGLGAEIGFALFAWKRYDLGTLLLAGALAGVGFSPQWYFQYGGKAYGASVVTLYTIITIISGAVLGGWLPKLIGDALYRAGVLRNFAIAKANREGSK